MEVTEYDYDVEQIKDIIKSEYEYFKPNYDRFNEFRRFVFDTSLKNEEKTLLLTIQKPVLEFNVLEAYISRLLGEFSKQEPDIIVSPDDQNNADPSVITFLEQHLRHMLNDAKNEHTRYEIYKDLLSGGFSTAKIKSDYAHKLSFDQVLDFERTEPTLTGFDHMAKYSHKGDGRYCFELFPMAKAEFMTQYPDIKMNELSFSKGMAGFNWSYINDKTEVVIVADFYVKKIKRTKIVKLKNGRVLTLKQYNTAMANWDSFEMPPEIAESRITDIETICRYRIIENQILEYIETDFEQFPLVFFDGNSILIRNESNGNARQMTRPAVYHAMGAQRLKNYAGISLANEIESSVQSKFIVKKEAIPKEADFIDAIINPQKASTIVVNAFFEQNPDQIIPDPIREVNRMPAPPEIAQSFTGADSVIQNILGSYDASLGINDNQLSGIAIVEGATQSNSTAMPYIVGFMQGLQRIAQIYVTQLPKYYTTPRTMPIIDEEGQRSYQKINQEGGIDIFYDTNALNVVVKAGASFQVQKSRTINMVKEIMGMSQEFSAFMSSKGLPFILDNVEGKGVEQLKKMTGEWQKEMEQQKQMAMQAQQQEMQNNPAMIKEKVEMAKLEHAKEKSKMQFEVDLAKMQQDENKILADLERSKNDTHIALIKANTDKFNKALTLKLMAHDQRHRHMSEAAKFHHEITRPTDAKQTQRKTNVQ